MKTIYALLTLIGVALPFSQFARWLIEHGFQGKEGQQIPEMSEEYIETVSERYIELYERITGLDFVKETEEDIITRIANRVSTYLLS